MISISLKQKIASSFGAIGYFFCATEWLWSILLYFSLLESAANNTISDEVPTIIEPVITHSGPNLASIMLLVIFSVFMLALSIYVLIKLPSKITKTSKIIVNTTAKSAAPFVLKLQHKRVTKKYRIKLTAMIILILKIVLIIVPLILAFIAQFTAKPDIDPTIAITIAIILAGLSIIAFAGQYILIRVFKLKTIE